MSSLLSALSALTEQVRSRMRSDDGLEMIEYALIAALIAVVMIAAVNLLDPSVGDAFNTIGNRVEAFANNIQNPVAPN